MGKVYGSRAGSGEGPGGAPLMAIGDALTDAGVVTVDALLPLWFALVKQHGGNRRLSLRLVQ